MGNAPILTCLQGKCITCLPRPRKMAGCLRAARSKLSFGDSAAQAGARPFKVESLECRVQSADMKHEKLKLRTQQFALKVIKFCEALPKDETGKTLGRQLLRSGCSVGANYRACCRAKSKADFISKMGTVLEEADESAYWIELLQDAGKVQKGSDDPLLREANELVAIAISSINTARRNSELGK